MQKSLNSKIYLLFPDSKRVDIKESLSNSNSKSPKTMKVLYPEEKAFRSTSEISLRETSGTAATTCVHVLGVFLHRKIYSI